MFHFSECKSSRSLKTPRCSGTSLDHSFAQYAGRDRMISGVIRKPRRHRFLVMGDLPGYVRWRAWVIVGENKLRANPRDRLEPDRSIVWCRSATSRHTAPAHSGTNNCGARGHASANKNISPDRRKTRHR